MGEVMSKRARLRAIHHLLEYAVTEVHELGLHQLEQLLAAATATITNEMKGRSHSQAADRPRRPQIRLVVDADNRQKGNGTKP
jgi:hypothetical protein